MSANVNQAAGVARYRLDASRSRFTVQAFAEGLLSSLGHNPLIAVQDFEGEVEFVPGTLEAARVRLTIRADSLATVGEAKESDRPEIDRQMRADALEVARYPEIVFESTSVTASRIAERRYRVRIIGNLTLHGVTQPNLWIHAEATTADDQLRAQGEFSLRQTDYKIRQVTALGGMLKVKNELKLKFDIAASRQ